MLIISRPSYIKCSFSTKAGNRSKLNPGILEIYYVKTKNLISLFSDFKNIISKDEQFRADRLYSEKDWQNFITSHAVLRLILGRYLKVNPSDISYKMGSSGKPGLIGDPLFFNLAHSGEEFAIALSRNLFVGIDLEEINQCIEIKSLAKSYFSSDENKFISKSESGIFNRFFLIWTRKEAILKALGTGIIDNLPEIEVSGRNNIISTELFSDMKVDHDLQLLFLYSKKINNFYLSIAIPQKVPINLYHLNYENIVSFFS